MHQETSLHVILAALIHRGLGQYCTTNFSYVYASTVCSNLKQLAIHEEFHS